jgi:ubiquinone/menaquinone biosynthesis C-methylase UbiE
MIAGSRPASLVALLAVACTRHPVKVRASAPGSTRDAEAKMFAKSVEYDHFMGRWSRQLSPLHIAFARVKSGDKVLDIGAGTGALALPLAELIPSCEIVGIDPSEDFIAYARAHTSSQHIHFDVGDAQALPYESGKFDRTLAQLVMNYIPDHEKALREMVRVTRPGGTISACVWDYNDGMQMLRYYWDAVVAIDPPMEPKDQRHMKLSHQGQLGELWRNAGLVDVDERPIDIDLHFTSFDDYWRPFLSGAGPAGAYLATRDEQSRNALEARLRKRVLGGREDGPFTLSGRAWCVRGTVPSAAR